MKCPLGRQLWEWDFSIFRKVKVLIYQSDVIVNIPMELLAFPILLIVGRTGTANHMFLDILSENANG